MVKTTHLNLPYISAAQAQKHVTHNQALRVLDAIVHLSVLDRDLLTPPTSPNEGDRYLVAFNATGDWSGQDHNIAAFQDGAWEFFAPNTGWLAWIVDEAGLVAFDGSGWVVSGGSASLNPASGGLVGVNATADATNRLSVNSPATLFNHEGSGHQVKVNKNTNTDTASILFQTGFSGRAEFGLVGEDSFSLKTSSDGNSFGTLFRASTGQFTISPQGEGGPVNFNIGPHHCSTAFTSGGSAMEISAGIPGDRHAFFDFHASDAQPDYSSRFIRFPGANGFFIVEEVGGGGQAFNCTNASAVVQCTIAGTTPFIARQTEVVPGLDNGISLGNGGLRWSSVWSVNGTIQTSDERDKIVQGPITYQQASDIVSAVDPVYFKWKKGGTKLVETHRETVPLNPDNPKSKTHTKIHTEEIDVPGNRTHAGFLAQDLKRAMDACGVDFGAWGLEDINDPDSKQFVRPDQLIPILWTLVQTLIEDRNSTIHSSE